MQSQFRTTITAIGNSKGIRLPKILVDQLNTNEVVLEAMNGGILIRPVRRVPPLSEWAKLMENVEITPDEDLEIWDETVGDGIDDEEN